MKNETNATGATDSRSVVFPEQEHVKSLPVVLSAFAEGNLVGTGMALNEIRVENASPAAEERTVPPVASVVDSTPTNWFELATELCAEGRITETRRLRAIAAVRQAVSK